MKDITISKIDLLIIVDKLKSLMSDLYDECDPVQASFRLGELIDDLEKI